MFSSIGIAAQHITKGDCLSVCQTCWKDAKQLRPHHCIEFETSHLDLMRFFCCGCLEHESGLRVCGVRNVRNSRTQRLDIINCQYWLYKCFIEIALRYFTNSINIQIENSWIRTSIFDCKNISCNNVIQKFSGFGNDIEYHILRNEIRDYNEFYSTRIYLNIYFTLSDK